MRRKLGYAKWLFFLAAGVMAWSLIGSMGQDRQADLVPTEPILQKVQALGELHTARYTYQNVYEHRTARKPAEWARWMPGVPTLVQASTENKALMQVHGEVEAGVDLSRAELKGDTLVLPKPKLYEPHVKARVHSHRAGTFWRDDNIALKGVEGAKVKLRAAAQRQGILAEAEANALRQLESLFPELGGTAIKIEFR